MNSPNYNHIVLFVSRHDSDELIQTTLKKHFKLITICKSLKEVCLALVDKKSKIFLLTGDSLEQTLHTYYRSLDAVSSYEICEHRVVSLIPRQDEEKAYNAYRAQIIDDYMLARPVYEPHRIVLICEHLFIELGVGLTEHSHIAAKYYKKMESLSDQLKESIQIGVQRKNEMLHNFETSIVEIENAIESASAKIMQNQQVDLDLEKLQKTLSAIRSDSIRPELLKLQSKVISLLEQSLDIKNSSIKNKLDNPYRKKPKQKQNYEFNLLYNNDIDADEVLKKNSQLPKILVVEDDVISLQLTRKLLSHYTVQVECVTNGRQAFASLTSKKYDLVLMDVNLPDTNGIYIVGQATSTESVNATTPIIMLSGNKNKNTIKNAIERGAKGYIVKPLHKSTMDKLFSKYII